MPFVLKSGNFNLLEPSGPVQACNGITLPLPLPLPLPVQAMNAWGIGLLGLWFQVFVTSAFDSVNGHLQVPGAVPTEKNIHQHAMNKGIGGHANLY